MVHSSRSLPPLETLRAFEAAARTGSFSAAAETLNLTHGAVSGQVAKLEARLGLKVFEREARGVSLTLEGQRLALRVGEAFALIAANTDRWSEPRGAAVVRLTWIPSISGLWLMPRLAKLEAGEPKLRVVLDAAAHGLGIALARPPLAADQLAVDRIRAVDPRTVPNPVSYWLDRPSGTAPRPAAAELARRIGREAELAEGRIEAFLGADR